MARLAGPPLTSQTVVSQGFITRRWGQWFSSLYTKLGGKQALGTYSLTVKIDDISIPSTVYLPVPADGLVRSVYSVIQGTITTNPEVITVRNPANSAIGTITIAANDVAGTVDSVDITTNNIVSQGDKISLVSTGDSTVAVAAWFIIVIEYT